MESQLKNGIMDLGSAIQICVTDQVKIFHPIELGRFQKLLLDIFLKNCQKSFQILGLNLKILTSVTKRGFIVTNAMLQ